MKNILKCFLVTLSLITLSIGNTYALNPDSSASNFFDSSGRLIGVRIYSCADNKSYSAGNVAVSNASYYVNTSMNCSPTARYSPPASTPFTPYVQGACVPAGYGPNACSNKQANSARSLAKEEALTRQGVSPDSVASYSNVSFVLPGTMTVDQACRTGGAICLSGGCCQQPVQVNEAWPWRAGPQ